MNDANRQPLMDAAESKTLAHVRGNSLRGNRETLEIPSPKAWDGPRRQLAVRRTCTFPGSRTVP